MGKQSRLRGIDWTVTLGCAALALMTLGAVGQSGRGRAKEVVCQANLHQWGMVFQEIIEENDGKFLSGATSMGYWWPIQLSHELQDWKRNRTWFCPTAVKPIISESDTQSGMLSIYNAWGVFKSPTSMTYKGRTYVANPNGFCGSLGLNGYVLSIPSTSQFEGGVPASSGWGNLDDLPYGDTIPFFLDAMRFDQWPKHTEAPAERESMAWSSNSMGRICINRHFGAVNCLFVDGSVRKVGLKELWTLRWHRSFNTAGPWTKAGGVQAEDWPEWLRPFREY